MAVDEEKSTRPYQNLSGFGSFSHFISSDSDHSTAVYRTFDRLSVRDLLHYEAELLELQALQDGYDREDAADACKADSASSEWLQIRRNVRDWGSFKRDAQEPSATGARWRDRMDLAMQIRTTLKEYREALLSNSEVLALSRPSKQTMMALSNTFHQKLPGSSSTDELAETDPILMGPSSQLFPALTKRSSLPPTDHVSLKLIPEPGFPDILPEELLLAALPKPATDRLAHLKYATIQPSVSTSLHRSSPPFSQHSSFSYRYMCSTMSPPTERD